MPCIPFALKQLLNFKLSLSSISYQTLSGPNKVRPHTCNCSQSSKSLRLQTNTSKGHSQCMAPDRQTDRLVHVLTDLVVEGSPVSTREMLLSQLDSYFQLVLACPPAESSLLPMWTRLGNPTSRLGNSCHTYSHSQWKGDNNKHTKMNR